MRVAWSAVVQTMKETVMRKIVAAVTMMLIALGAVTAEEFSGKITKIDGNKITIEKKAKKGEKGDEVTLTVADKVKVIKGGKFNKETKKFEGGDPIEGGLKASDVKAGAAVRVTTDDNKITEIRIVGKKKKDAN
jgi:hypothetical protein